MEDIEKRLDEILEEHKQRIENNLECEILSENEIDKNGLKCGDIFINNGNKTLPDDEYTLVRITYYKLEDEIEYLFRSKNFITVLMINDINKWLSKKI